MQPIRHAWLLLTLCLMPACAAPPPRSDAGFGRPHIDAVDGPAKVTDDAKVVHYGRVIYRGKIDVNPTLDRIHAGERLNHGNDGAYFRNFEGLLPKQKDRDYYREFVHRMKGLPFPGPQRVVIGKNGAVWYTGNHYASFTQVR